MPGERYLTEIDGFAGLGSAVELQRWRPHRELALGERLFFSWAIPKSRVLTCASDVRMKVFGLLSRVTRPPGWVAHLEPRTRTVVDIEGETTKVAAVR